MRGPVIQNWKWGIWAAVAMTLLSLYPQVLMWGVRNRDWNGAYAQVNGDEWVYSAYVQALIDGRPRRNDPYTGRDDRPDHPQPESLFSIQFVPAYLIAVPARLVGISSSTAFIVLGILTPFFSCLAIFWLLANLTRDYRIAAAGCILVLCFGGLAAGVGAVHRWSAGFGYLFLPFLRRYEPAAVFPLFFLFCTFVWRSLATNGRVTLAWAGAAGLALDALIFSYFYLWTAALGWLACLLLMWLIARRRDLRRRIPSFVTILLLAVSGLIPYFLLLSRRSATMESGQKLIFSHSPDLFRIPELLGIAVIALIAFDALRGRANWRAPTTLFSASFSLMPFITFNQQVITGRSLQPFHYELFIANYVVLVGAVVGFVIIWRGPEFGKEIFRYHKLGWVVIIALWWAAIEVLLHTNVLIRESQFIDRAAAVCERLRLSQFEGEVAKERDSRDPRPLVLSTVYDVSIYLPTFAPQAVLWAPNFDFLNLGPGENRERFFKYLYYSGIDGSKLADDLAKPAPRFATAVFGHERVIPDLSVAAKPISSDEIIAQVKEYEAYIASFTRDRATQHTLSYLIVPVRQQPDLANLDRWYQRDEGQQVGDYLLYRIHLRP